MSETIVLDISEKRSSFVKRIEYNEDENLLSIHVRPYQSTLYYSGVFKNVFEEFSKQNSIGKYYIQFIKPNFKQIKLNTMAERPKTKNQASDQKRFIKLRINVRDINKAWLVAGEKGDYLDMTLQMLPDGKLDKFGNLGMITQDVPKSIYEKEKQLPKTEKTQGAILGNGAELDWNSNTESQPGSGGDIGNVEEENLPF